MLCVQFFLRIPLSDFNIKDVFVEVFVGGQLERNFLHYSMLFFGGRPTLGKRKVLLVNTISRFFYQQYLQKKLVYHLRFWYGDQSEAHSELPQTSKMDCFAKTVNSWKQWIMFRKKLHFRCLNGFWIHHCWHSGVLFG